MKGNKYIFIGNSYFILKLYSYGGELRYIIGYTVIEDDGVQNDAPGIILEVRYSI